MGTQSLEDYLEAIYRVLRRKERAKTNDIASRLGVKASSVTEMFQRLKQDGYINYEKYLGATLTEEGEEVAKNVSEVHENVRKFLELLQVPPEKADEDACKVEHTLSEKSIEQLNKFIKFVEDSPGREVKWLEHFHHYSRHSEFPPECDSKDGNEADTTTSGKRLSELEYGQEGVIKHIDRGLKDKIAGRGIREGKEIRMDTKQPINGPVVVTIDRSVTSLGLDLARKILVEVNE